MPFDKFPQIFNRFFTCKDNTLEGIAWVQVPNPAAALELKNRLKQSHPEYIAVNPRLAVHEFVDAARGELKVTVIFAALLILLILLLFLRSPGAVLLVLIPMSLGLLTTVGLMGHIGIQLNVFNFIVLPILIGIGLDDGIHIYRRHREMKDIEKTLTTTGRSVLVTTLTTICGFGSLSLADYHILKSMGLSAAFGVSACFIYSITTLPAMLKLINRTKD